MNPQQAYDGLITRSRETFTVHSIGALVSWDQQVNMPPKGVSHRAEMMAYLAQLEHQKQTDPRLGGLLADAEAKTDWGPDESANLREWRRDYDHATKLPEELVRRQAQLVTQANQIWQEARAASNFGAFAPALGQLIDLNREIADHLGWQGERYDALLDLFEPGLTTAQCEPFFEGLRTAVVPLLKRIMSAPQQSDTRPFRNAVFPQDKQREFGMAVTKAMGFDYQAGRLDVSAHPFTQGIFPGDVRLTTRYDEHWPFQALFGTIHEGGHGIYDQGLPAEWQGTPRGTSVSLGIHESQSRFWENNVGRSRAFWVYWYPRFCQAFGAAPEGAGLDDFYHLANRVQPSLIRVEADEVTYNLHIMVRFEIERDLFRGALQPADLPRVWNAKYKSYLGVDVPDDRNGVLQDIHWSWGMFGYFPTYALGTVYAAQLEAALRRDVPDLDEQMAEGRFGAAFDWMRSHVHRYGMLYRPAALMQNATGKPPSSEDYVAYLARKYGELYR